MTATRPATGDRTLPEVTATLAGLGLELRRSWPRAEDHLLLDLCPAGRSGAHVAGQWFSDPGRARAVADATPGATWSGQVVLQGGGADRRLASLAALLAEPGTELVGHRPERRAVLRHRSGGEVAYTKVVPRRRHRALEVSARAAEALELTTPRVLHTDAGRGTVTTAAVPGRPLHDLLGGPDAERACEATGAALARLHRLPLPPEARPHTWSDELAVAGRWQRFAAAFGVAPRRPDGEDPCPPPYTDRPTLVHRDLHDQQVLVDDDGSVGFLDFDLMGAGDPALDLANLLVHLDLRGRQGLAPDASPLRRAVLRGYAPAADVVDRLPAYQTLARRRLAAVYAFRPTAAIT